jgi:hypothetical protein
MVVSHETFKKWLFPRFTCRMRPSRRRVDNDEGELMEPFTQPTQLVPEPPMPEPAAPEPAAPARALATKRRGSPEAALGPRRNSLRSSDVQRHAAENAPPQALPDEAAIISDNNCSVLFSGGYRRTLKAIARREAAAARNAPKKGAPKAKAKAKAKSACACCVASRVGQCVFDFTE